MTATVARDKPFGIDKWEVWQAWRDVRANNGAPGVDGISIEDFEKDLRDNLYKVWNRMSSGSYHPPGVRAVAIEKADGGQRVLGIPTVADRVAQAVVANRLGPRLERVFHPDSYGYRPGRSAADAVGRCWQRCRQRGWVVKIDLRSFFDTVPHDLMVRALRAHLDPDTEGWISLYVQRWLRAEMVHPDGRRVPRDRGTPQGGVVSPVLANLFLHYALDAWMARNHPGAWFERYADDIVVHSANQRQARRMLSVICARMAEVGLQVHPDKTAIVYCRGGRHQGVPDAPVTFDFLGFTFAPRTGRTKTGTLFLGFSPAPSRTALKEMGRRVRRWRVHRRPNSTLRELATMINPVVAGWINYYGRFRPSTLYPLLRRINAYLMRWARNKYRRLHRWRKAITWWRQLVKTYPRGFAHWRLTTEVSTAGMGRAV